MPNLITFKCLSESVEDDASVILTVYMIKPEDAWQLYCIR